MKSASILLVECVFWQKMHRIYPVHFLVSRMLLRG